MLSESIVIDQYLAKKFNLLGNNEYEEWTIKAHYSNIHYLRERSLMKMTWTWSDKRAEALELFLEKTLPDFIASHEFHLRGNGSNGHYVGDRVRWFVPVCFLSLDLSEPDKPTVHTPPLTLFCCLSSMSSFDVHRLLLFFLTPSPYNSSRSQTSTS